MKKVLALLVSLVFANIAFAHQDITLNFALKAGDESVACGEQIVLGSTQSMTELLDARLFLSNLRVLTASGEEIPIELSQDGVWQYENVVLLDFENATGQCQGTAETNTQVIGETETDELITGIAFTVGIPEDLNHLDAAMAASPLNITDMWWAWLFGYKFMKIDLTSGKAMMADHAATDTESQAAESHATESHSSEAHSDHSHGDSLQTGWFIHLGSTGCVGQDFVFPPDEPCANPNRIEVKLDLDVKTNAIILDLDKLLQHVDVSRSLKLEPPGCMSEATDPDCLALFTTGFGLSLENGQQLVDSPAFFRVE